jgi:nicotinate dehydrogenase subunit B
VQFDSETVHSVDWASYPILEMADAPQHIEVVMIDPTAAAPSGAGEPTIRSVPAAVANAFFDATGKRLRRAPFTPERVKNTLAQQSSKRNTR